MLRVNFIKCDFVGGFGGDSKRYTYTLGVSHVPLMIVPVPFHVAPLIDSLASLLACSQQDAFTSDTSFSLLSALPQLDISSHVRPPSKGDFIHANLNTLNGVPVEAFLIYGEIV